jgi:hypothetical protein
MADWLGRSSYVFAAAVTLAGRVAGMAALRAAGLNGTAPPNAAIWRRLISTLTSNWEWLIGTGVGLVLTLIAGLMMAGSQRAPDRLFQVIGGIMLILIVIPAFLA